MLIDRNIPQVPRLRTVAAVALATVAVFLAAVAVVRSGNSNGPAPAPAVSNHASAGYPGALPTAVGTDPALDGSGQNVASPAAASAIAGFAVAAPNTALAGPSNLSDTWIMSTGSESGTARVYTVDLDYVSSNIRIDYSAATGTLLTDPPTALAALAMTLGLPSSDVGTADGVSALIVPPSSGQNGMLEGRDGLVLLVRNGVRIAIMGRGGQSAADLVAIANSIG